MQSRTKVEQRKTFTKTEKRAMLEKSNNKCCHCGTILDIHSMSVEHAVPISKAGENDKRNLVALCKTCNPMKADTVLTNAVPAYYKYLKQDSMLKLLDYIEEYSKSYGYFEWNNFTQEDDTLITPKNMPTAMQQINYKEDIKSMPKLILHKVKYSDLDDVADFYETKLKSVTSKKEVIEALSESFLTGAIYCIRTPYNEIVGAFSISISLKGTTAFEISNIVYSTKYYKAMKISLNWVLNNMKDNIKSKVYGIYFCSNEPNNYSVVSDLVVGKPMEITYKLSKKERNKGIRVWQIYVTKSKPLMDKQVTGKVLSVLLKNFEKELDTYRRAGKKYLLSVLSYENQKHFKYFLN